jgi:hypothetical protein
MQLECGFTIDLPRAAGQCRFENLHAVGDGLEEALLLDPEHLGHARGFAPQFGIRITHLGRQRRHEFVEEGLPRAELVAVANRAPRDAAQHIAAALVAWNHAIGHRERAGADVIGDHLQRRRLQISDRCAARCQHGVTRGRQQLREQVDLVVRMHVLQHRGQPLQPHAGVDTGLGQLVHHTVFGAVELHEDVVPDLDVAVAVLLGAARRATRHLGTMVVEDLAARSAGAGVAHHPEVVRLIAGALVVADAHHPLGRQANLLDPDIECFVVLGIHRGPQLVGRQLEAHGQQLPREGDRILFEVVAEAEVAEHLEERVVARGVAPVLEVVVLAAGADALLRGGRARVGPLARSRGTRPELVHAGVGEQQRRVVARHHRRAGHHLGGPWTRRRSKTWSGSRLLSCAALRWDR